MNSYYGIERGFEKTMLSFIICCSLIIVLSIWIYFLQKRQSKILRQLDDTSKSNNKNWMNYNMGVKLLNESSIEIAKRLKQKGFSNVAVYGMGPIGRYVVKELMKNDIEVSYAIDQNAELIYADVSVYNSKDILPRTDAVIVTAIYYYEEIKDTIENKVKCPVVSLYDFLT